MSKHDLKEAFEKHSQTREPKTQYFSGNLGIALNGSLIVNVPGRPSYVFVRILGNTSELVQAYNSEVSIIYDLPVLVSRVGQKWVVTGRDIKRYGNWGTSPRVAPHGIQHTYDTNGYGGGDIVWVRSEQFLPLDTFPVATGTALTIYPYTYSWNGTWKQAIATGTSSFIPHNPSGTSTSRMVLLYIDGATGNPVLVDGIPFSSSITGIVGILPYIPMVSLSVGIPLVAVRRETGSTTIAWTEMYDLRQFFLAGATGTSSSSTSSGTYLHESLTDLLGGSANNHWHLTPSQITGLVSGTVTALHSHSGTTSSGAPYNSSDFTGTLWADLTDGGMTTLHGHNYPPTPGGRLTPTTGVPVITSNVSTGTHIYYTPYIHDVIELWNGTYWQPITFTEYNITIGAGSLTAGKGYDIFAYLNAGALALETLIWTSGTARATAITLQDGRYCKSGDKTRLYLGSFYARTTSNYNCQFSVATNDGGKWDLWNMYNRKPFALSAYDTTDSWAYTTVTIRQARANTGNKVEFFLGLQEDEVFAKVMGYALLNANVSQICRIGCGLDTTTAMNGLEQPGYNAGNHNVYVPVGGELRTNPAVGYHYISWNEGGSDVNCTFLGDNNSNGQAGLYATVWA